MEIQKEIEEFETAFLNAGGKERKLEKNEDDSYTHSSTEMALDMFLQGKANAVPDSSQVLNDRLLVKSIREHVESHIAEISVNDLFDKGWIAAMKCIQNNIDMLEAQELSDNHEN